HCPILTGSAMHSYRIAPHAHPPLKGTFIICPSSWTAAYHVRTTLSGCKRMGFVERGSMVIVSEPLSSQRHKSIVAPNQSGLLDPHCPLVPQAMKGFAPALQSRRSEPGRC